MTKNIDDLNAMNDANTRESANLAELKRVLLLLGRPDAPERRTREVVGTLCGKARRIMGRLRSEDYGTLREFDLGLLKQAVKRGDAEALRILLRDSPTAGIRRLEEREAKNLFAVAATNLDLPVVRVLLESPELAEHIELSLEADGLIHSLAAQGTRPSAFALLRYLLCESPAGRRFSDGFCSAVLDHPKRLMRIGAEGWNSLVARHCEAGAWVDAPVGAEDRIVFELPGQPELEEAFNRVIDPILRPEKYRMLAAPPRPSLLLYGPPGCGKTYAVDRLCDFLAERGWKRFTLKPDILDEHAHTGPKKLAAFFVEAYRHERAVVVIDELEGLMPDRSRIGDNLWLLEEIDALLVRLQEARERGVLVVAMTNLLNKVDAAARRSGRFDRLIEVTPPPREAVERMVRSCLEGGPPLGGGLCLDTLVDALTGAAVSDIAALCEEVKFLCCYRGKRHLDQDCLDEALAGYRKRRARAGAALKRKRPSDPLLGGGRPRGQDGVFQLAGRRELCRRLNELVIAPLLRPEGYARFGFSAPPSLLLHGGPGCGKTFAVDKLVEHLGWPCVRIEASDVYSDKAHEHFIRERFEEAFAEAEDSGHAVVVMDELDSFLPNRANAGNNLHRLEEVNEFLACLQKARDRGVLVIGMCNDPRRLDPAALRPGRFDLKIRVENPTREEARELLEEALAPYPQAPGLDLEPMLDALAGRSVAEVSLAQELARRRAAWGNRQVLDQDCLDAALEEWRNNLAAAPDWGIGRAA